MHDNIPGVEVPDAIFARMDGLQDQDAKDEGVRIAVELIEALRNIGGVSGAHVMAPGWETEAVPRIVESLPGNLGPARMPIRPAS